MGLLLPPPPQSYSLRTSASVLCGLGSFCLSVCLPLDRNVAKVNAASLGMGLTGRRGRRLAVPPGVSSGALDFSLFLGELVSQSIWSPGATGVHRTEFLTTGPARQPAPWSRASQG